MGWKRGRAWVITALAGGTAVAAILLAAVSLPDVLASASASAALPLPCNGHVELCGRRFDEVAFAATHNAMASADGGYLWPFQEHDIAWQLDHGIRVLLIDTHYWADDRDAEAFAAHLPPEAAATVRATAARAGPPAQGVYLCHVACALGHTPLAPSLGDVRAFLDTHPREVMAIFFQDAVSARDTEAAFAESGLLPYILSHRAEAPWPTLGQMIASGRRLVVFAENGGPPPSWYAHGWDVIQDTGYNVHDPAQFSCALNRGRASNTLFLLNHWVAKLTPDPADAARVNAYAFLLRRARQCMRERGRLPNFVAVNFAEQGDLLRVVDALNGLEAAPAELARK